MNIYVVFLCGLVGFFGMIFSIVVEDYSTAVIAAVVFILSAIVSISYYKESTS